MNKVRVWDLPLRLFHWTLTVAVAAAIITQKIGGNAMEWHFRAGYAALALVAFRIVWGFVGPRYARFASFLYRPSAVVDYLRSGSEGGSKYLGHNPLGALSVFALLGIVLVQAASGLFANDDIASEGPLVKFISKELSDSITGFHKDVSGTLIYILIGLHLAAIAFYFFRKRRNLVRPMITGDQQVEYEAPSANDSWGVRLAALALFGVCAAGVYWLIGLQPA